MSNGIASGVPPDGGCAGGAAGAGVCACANAGELRAAMAQTVMAIEAMVRMYSSQLKLVFVL
jgi:hypothetical protein